MFSSGKHRWCRESDAAEPAAEPEPTAVVQQAPADRAAAAAADATAAADHPREADARHGELRWTRVHGASATAADGRRDEPGRVSRSVQRRAAATARHEAEPAAAAEQRERRQRPHIAAARRAAGTSGGDGSARLTTRRSATADDAERAVTAADRQPAIHSIATTCTVASRTSIAPSPSESLASTRR